MPIIDLRLSRYFFYWNLYSKELNDNCKERVFQNKVFLLEPVNVALGVEPQTHTHTHTHTHIKADASHGPPPPLKMKPLSIEKESPPLSRK